MLLQLGLAPAVATLCSALLFVPCVLKPLMRPWVIRVGHFRRQIHFVEALLFAGLVLLALSFGTNFSLFSFHFSLKAQPFFVFLALMLVSLLCAWHELAARMYYERTLSPSFRRLLAVPKHICSQVAVIFTYGALIFFVGMLQVYFRQIRYSWSLGCYVAAGLFLLFVFLHLMTLAPSPTSVACAPLRSARDGGQGWRGLPVLILFLLLLPQALMFYARVLYLYGAHVHGGLQCTIQEIGFAQGTIGVIAFSVGLFLSRRLLIKEEKAKRLKYEMDNRGQAVTSTFHLFNFSTLSLVLSPFVYLGMTLCPPQALWQLCLCTMTAQLLFGFGLGACRLPIRAISGTRYRDTVSMLQIPLVSAVMIVPMAVSGWMVEQLGYSTYFLVNALAAPVCLLLVFFLRRRRG